MSCRGYKGQKAEQPLLRRRSCIAPYNITFFLSTEENAGHLEEEDLQLQPPAEEELSQVGGDKGRPISGFANAIFNGHNFIHHFGQLNMM